MLLKWLCMFKQIFFLRQSLNVHATCNFILERHVSPQFLKLTFISGDLTKISLIHIILKQAADIQTSER